MGEGPQPVEADLAEHRAVGEGHGGQDLTQAGQRFRHWRGEERLSAGHTQVGEAQRRGLGRVVEHLVSGQLTLGESGADSVRQ